MALARRPFLACAAVGLALAPRLARAEAPVLGSGTASTQRREIGAFSSIALGAPFSVVLRAAGREAIEIVADDNLVPLIETTLRGAGSDRALQIELQRHVRIEPRTPIVIVVDYVRLDEIAVGGAGRVSARSVRVPRLEASIGGAGSIDLAGLDVDRLAVAIGGSGAFRADGGARRLSISVAGSGHCNAERLVAADVAVSVAGSGDARVHADKALRVSIAGSGDVYHLGAAPPQVSAVGSGRVVRL